MPKNCNEFMGKMGI